MSSNTEDLRAEISALLPCVACDGSGGYQTGEDDYEQCQYCYQFRFPAIDKLITRDSTLKAEYEEKVRQARVEAIQLYMDTCEREGVPPSWRNLREFQGGQKQALAELNTSKNGEQDAN